MKPSNPIAACALLLLAGLGGCAGGGAPQSADGAARPVAPMLLPAVPCKAPVCNITVNVTGTPGQKNCTGTVTSEIDFSGTTSTATNIPIVWTLTPSSMGKLSFEFKASNGIQVVTDTAKQLSQVKLGYGPSTNNWQYSAINAQNVAGSQVTYGFNVQQIDNSGSIPVISDCVIADPRIINS